MSLNFTFVLVVGFLLSASPALAQSSLEGFATGRYEVRKTKKSAKYTGRDARKPSSTEDGDSKAVTDSDGVKVKLLTEKELAAEHAAEEKAAAKSNSKVKTEQKKSSDDKTSPEKDLAATEVVSVQANEEQRTEKAEEPSISEQAQSLFSRQADRVYDFYRQTIHPDDIRNNKVEIEVSPILGYNDSTSSYSFRKYQAYFEALKVKANVWLTPLIGLSGQIMFSFGADIDDANHSKVPVKYENLDLGLNFRKFFGESRRANSLEFSVLYSDDEFKVSNSSQMHPRLKTRGLGVGLKARLPSSESYSWVLGGAFYPRLQHSETATAVNVNSGSTDENVRLGFDLGGEWKFSRFSQMLWSIGLSSERNLFSGSSSLPDSSTGVTPTNVSVTNTIYTFNLGYRWGH